MSAWSGIGIHTQQPYGSFFEFNATTHAAIAALYLPEITKFPRIRIIADRASANSQIAQRLWAQDIKAYKPSTYIHYGIANNGGTLVYLPQFYATYLPIMLKEAQWAQDNLMDEFQVGNEFEISTENGTITVTSLNRTNNTVTLVVTNHGLQTGDTIVVTGATPTNFNTTQDTVVTVIDANTLNYYSTGSDGAATGIIKLQAGAQTIIRFVKLLASAAQAVFTRGNITYSVSQGHETAWTSITPGVDLDTIGLDEYGGNSYSYDQFVANVTAFYNTFGSLMYLSEFNVTPTWANASINGVTPAMERYDKIYADEITKIVQFIKNLGIPQAYFYQAWQDDNEFAAFYNNNPLHGNFAGGFTGGFKQVYDALLEQPVTHLFLGAQTQSSGSPVLAVGQPVKILDLIPAPKDFITSLDFRSGGIVKINTRDNPFSGNSYYVSAWVKWYGGNTAFQHIVAKRDSYGISTMNLDLVINPANNNITLDTGNGNRDFGVNLPIGRWVPVVYVHLGNPSPVLQEQLFIDGNRISSQSNTNQGTGTDALLSIGAAEAGAIEPFNGLIDEVVIGTYAPSWSDVIAMARKLIYQNVWAYWKFDEKVNTQVLDSSGNNKNGNITTAIYSTDVARHK